MIILAAHEAITVTWARLAPGERGPDPHVHHEHTDSFYVLDGELGFRLGPDREPLRLGAGSLVAAPPNVVHTFVNDGEGEVRFLNIHTPDGGFAALMRARHDGEEGVSFDISEPPPGGGRPLADAVVSRPGEGERLVSGARVALLKSSLPELCLAEFSLDGEFDGPGVHVHEVEADSFYVLEGELEFTVEDSVVVGGPGTLASVPRGVRHTFAQHDSKPARFLNIHAPDAGFADFLRRVSD